ncbi:MAG: type II toxin-antitoxin system death-on-curing family toxin [bacterium]|nr:type II toxin-antitoxin system death-on-curing family toxin [bacterium]
MNSTNDNPLGFLTAQDLTRINEQITGDVMIRDVHLLNSALRRPFLILFGEEQFPTVIDKAAAYLESLAYHHLFVDGNKRTAIEAVRLFLERNDLTFAYDPAKDALFVLEVAQGAHDTAQIAAWIEARTR